MLEFQIRSSDLKAQCLKTTITIGNSSDLAKDKLVVSDSYVKCIGDREV